MLLNSIQAWVRFLVDVGSRETMTCDPFEKNSLESLPGPDLFSLCSGSVLHFYVTLC